jgi:carbamoyl-phosphate synthase large subunit
MVRPSYVLGGRGMEIVHDEEMLVRYVEAATGVTPDRPLLIDRFLENAMECEADAISDGTDAFVPAVMQHIEYAGVHSGDSACVIPPVSIPPEHIATIEEYTRKIAIELGVVGLMNIQYAISEDTVYVLEANPRASRTVPIVSKVCNVQMARLATEVMLGAKLADLDLHKREFAHFGVKEAVFPFGMFPEVDPLLGPEMRSTGEVLGLASSFGLAFNKAQEAVGQTHPAEGTVLITVAERDRELMVPAVREFSRLGFEIRATEGTAAFLNDLGIACTPILKLHEGRPNIADAIMNGEIDLVVNTPAGKSSEFDDSYIRKAAIRHGIPYITTSTAALAAARGIAARRESKDVVRSLQSYHAAIRGVGSACGRGPVQHRHTGGMVRAARRGRWLGGHPRHRAHAARAHPRLRACRGARHRRLETRGTRARRPLARHRAHERRRRLLPRRQERRQGCRPRAARRDRSCRSRDRALRRDPPLR